MCYILMGVVLLAGCTEYRLSQKDAVKNALSFQSDRKAIKDTFAQLSTMSAYEGRKLLEENLGKDNLSTFLLTQRADVTNCFALFVDISSTVVIRRCLTAGKSLVTYSDLSMIETKMENNGKWIGSFVFNVENSYTGICRFIMIESDKGYMISKLYVPGLGSEASTSNLVVFDKGNIEHLRKNKDRRFFEEGKPEAQ